MRRTTLLIAAMAAALVAVSGAALAQIINCPTGANGLCVGTQQDDRITGTAVSDDIRGLGGDDILKGRPDLDTVSGGQGADTVNGGDDNDQLNGGPGPDSLNGGPGDDSYIFANNWGSDTITDDAALGISGERLSFTLVTTPITMDLIPKPRRPEVQSGTNRLNFGANVSVVEIDGSSSGDIIRGQADADGLNGIQGNDSVSGRGGADNVIGMEGNDTLNGGGGPDDIDAGTGSDRILAADNAADTITCGGGEDTVAFDQGVDTLLDPNRCENQNPS